MTKINIQFTLFSAFYSPLISTMSGGFLEAEGLEPSWSISPPGKSAIRIPARRQRPCRADGAEPIVQLA